MVRQPQASYPLPVSADWKLRQIVRELMKRNHSFRVHYPTGEKGDVIVYVLREDLDWVRELNKPAMLIEHSIDLDDAKKEIADCIRDCLEADDDSAYLIQLINEGHSPSSWADDGGGEKVVDAVEDEDDDSQIMLRITAETET